MENRTPAEVSFIESLIEKSEQYTQTSVELLALQALHKGSDIAGAMLSRLILVLCLMSFLFLFNLAVAFWLGHLWGKWHYGFFAVAGFLRDGGGNTLFFTYQYSKPYSKPHYRTNTH